MQRLVGLVQRYPLVSFFVLAYLFAWGLVLLTGGLQLAETHGYTQSELRARLNISFLQQPDEPRASAAIAPREASRYP